MKRFSVILVRLLLLVLVVFPCCALADSTILDMEVTGPSVCVEWQSTEDALLTVEIVEDGKDVPYASESVVVSGEDQYGEEKITFENMPEYFTIEAYFAPVGGGTGSEGMGTVFVEDLYTQPVQEMLNSDWSEYKDDERYLEFFIDENGEKSFGVLTEQFKVMRTSELEGTVTIRSTDDDENGMPEKVTITSTNGSADEAWFEDLAATTPTYLCIVDDKNREIPDYSKPDVVENPIQYHMMYLDSATDIANGLQLTNANPPEAKQRGVQDWMDKLLDIFSVYKFKSSWDLKNQSSEGNGYAVHYDIKGSVSIQSILTSARRIEINNDFNFKKIELDGASVSETVSILSKNPLLTIGGINTYMDFVLEFNGGQHVSASMSGNMKHTFNMSGQNGGTRIDHMKFYHIGPQQSGSAPQKLKIKAGPKLEVEANFLLLKAILSGDAYTTIELIQGQESSDVIWHACGTDCVEGFPAHQQKLNIWAKVNYLLGSKVFLDKDLVKTQAKAGKEFYHSEKFNTSGDGLCPYKGYKTTVRVLDAHGKELELLNCSYTPVRPAMLEKADSNATPGVLYIPASTTPVTVQATYVTPADAERTLTQQIIKKAEASEVIFQLEEEYWLIFDKDGKDVTWVPPAVSCRHDDIIMIPSEPPVRPGFDFAGWSFKPKSDPSRQVDYQIGDPFWMTDELFGESNSVTLYPVWEGESYLYYTVKPEDEGKVTNMPWVDVNSTFISPIIPKRGEDDYFVGWMDDHNTLPNLPLMPNPYYPNSGTLTAQFVSTAFMHPTVTFDAGEHADGFVLNMPKPVETTIGVPFKLPTKIPFLVDLDFWSVDVPQFFVGWSLFEGSKIPTFFPGMDFVALTDTTLYAVWVNRPDFYLLSYDANGGSGAPWTGLNSKTISSTVPTRPGHVFEGWVKDEDLNNIETDPTPVAGADTYQPGDPNPFYQEVEEDGEPVLRYRSGTLYAVWTPSNDVCTVSFDANGGSDAPDGITVLKDTTITIPAKQPLAPLNQTGLQFAGWGGNPNGYAAVLQPGDSYTVTQDTTLYAQWDANQLVVSYDANGGTGAPEAQVFTVGDANRQLSNETPSRENYLFQGWALSSTAEEAQYQPGDVYTGTQSATLYAVWKADSSQTCLITYDANGGEHAPEAQLVRMNEATALSEQIPFRENYIFKGWVDASQASYQPGDSCSFAADVTLYAVWEPDLVSLFTINYHANQGDTSSVPQPQYAAEGETIQLSMEVPVRDNHIFMGWARTPDASEDEYQPGDDYTCTGNVTLYAVWSRDAYKIYTVHYDANGGYEASVPADESAFKGEMITLSEKAPVRLYHRFKGWAFDAAAETANFQPGALFTASDDTTLYAVWEMNPASIFTVTYHANGGSGAPEPHTGFVGEPVTLSTEEPVKEHCRFLGWATSPTAAAAEFAPGQQCLVNGAITLYAVWEIVEPIQEGTIQYNANGGDPDSVPDDQTVALGEMVRIPDQKPTHTEGDKYVFLGWASTEDAKTAQFDMGETFVCTGNQILYAVWTENYAEMYSVIYHANGGTGAPEAQMAFSDTRIRLSVEEPCREGYAFLGWATISTAEEASFQPGEEFPADTVQPPYESANLYAVWENDPKQIYTVTYDANGGIDAPASQSALNTEKITLSGEEPVWRDYRFLGWTKDPLATTAQFKPSDDFPDGNPPYADAMLYAVWDKSPQYYVVSYDANGGEGAPAPSLVRMGNTMQLSEVQPVRENFAFMGWATDPENAQVLWQPGATFEADKDTTLYAVWEDDLTEVYTVTYDANGGTNAPQPQAAFKGKTIQLSTLEATWENHAFLGWAQAKEAEEAQYQPGASLKPDGNITLYAVWEEDPLQTYTVSYHANGAEVEVPASQTEVKGKTIQLSKSYPLHPKWTFKGWALQSDSMLASYFPGDTFPNDNVYEDTDLYAIWDKDEDGIYTVTYDANGGTGAPKPQFTYVGNPMKLSAEQPVREGYTFRGWALKPDAEQAKYQGGRDFPGETLAELNNFALYTDTTLYAVWEAKSDMVYTVTYNTNGGEGSFEPQTALVGSSVKLHAQQPTLDKKVFLGWAFTPSATRAALQPGETCQFVQDTELYAVWEWQRYTISYNANGGKNAPKPQSALAQAGDTTITLHDASHNPTRDHHVFLGWAKSPLAQAADYQPGASCTVYADVTLYAVWAVETGKLYTVTYHANGGDPGSVPQQQTAVYGEAITLSLQRPVYPQHTFGGWARSYDSAEAAFQPGQYYNKYESMQLWALWSTDPRTIIFDDNGGFNGPGSQTFLGETVVIAPEIPVRPGYRFEGWSLSAVPLQTVCATPEAAFVWPEGNADMHLTLYAVWTYDPSYQPEQPDVPKTGDVSALMLWVALMLSSGSGILLMSRRRKQREN